MPLQRLDISGVRNIKKATIQLSPGINFIYGPNASGKSALLEAVFLLSRLKSFRDVHNKVVVNQRADSLIISGEIYQNGCVTPVGVQIMTNGSAVASVNQQSVGRAELAYGFPVLIYHPKSYELLEAGSQLRREFLDWGVFHERGQFLMLWRQYKKILAHRNLLLKHRDQGQLELWTRQLIVVGEQVAVLRQQYMEKLIPVFITICQQFLQFEVVTIHYYMGWRQDKTLGDCLSLDGHKDLQRGFTHSGPHRGDFGVYFNSQLAKDYVSRGQLKMLVLALLLAQLELFSQQSQVSPCFLIDDFAAELDWEHRKKLLQHLSSLGIQVFVVANDKADFGDLQSINEYKMFHVEHGTIQ